MSNRPLFAGLVLTQVLFALACTGGASQDGRSAGDDVRLDDTEPPTHQERPDLQGDGRCDWLGSPFATPHDDRVFVLRMTDAERDCDRNPRVQSKLLFALEDGTRTPILDLSELSDIRMLGTNDGLILFTQNDDGSEHAWRIDPATGAVLQQADVFASIERTATSPSGRWVALGEDGSVNDQLLVQLFDPTDLSLHSLSLEGRSGGYTWLPGDQLVTAGFLPEGGLRLRVWDLSGEELPTEPDRDVTVDGLTRTWNDAVLTLSGDHQRLAVPAQRQGSDVAAVWDLESDETEIVPQMTGPFAYTDDDTLVGYHGESLRLIPAVEASQDITMDYWPELVAAPHGKYLLLGGGGGGMELFDLDAQAVLPLETGEGIEAFTRRGTEIWLASDEGVRRIDLLDGTHGVVSGAASRRTLYLPATDELYVDEGQAPTVHLLDPTDGATLQTLDLSGSIAGSPTALTRQ